LRRRETYLELHKQVASTAIENDIYVIDLFDIFSRYPARNLRVSDGHPNKAGHAVAAQTIYQWIAANKESIFTSRSGDNERQLN